MGEHHLQERVGRHHLGLVHRDRCRCGGRRPLTGSDTEIPGYQDQAA